MRTRKARTRWRSATAYFLLASGIGIGAAYVAGAWRTDAWDMHLIVAGASGNQEFDNADGIHLVDVNGDGCLDAATPYEEGRNATISIHPCDFTLVHRRGWPTVELPTISPNLCNGEDAALGDVDLDGLIDLVVGCEGISAGTNLSIFFNPGPATFLPDDESAAFYDPTAWTRVNITSAGGTRRHMRVIIANLVTADSAIELVVGQKEGSTCGGGTGAAAVGYWSSATPRTAASWVFTPIVAAGWVMNMSLIDVGGDGDGDILYGSKEHITCPAADTTRTGIRWLENLGGGTSWSEHAITTSQTDWRWHDAGDWDADGDTDVVACRATPGPNYAVNDITIYLASDAAWSGFATIAVPRPERFRGCQQVVMSDVNVDGVRDLVLSSFAAGATPSPSTSVAGFVGLLWLQNTGAPAAPTWLRQDISDVRGTKYDNVVMADAEPDGDPDLFTTEQQHPTGGGPGIGVFWRRNPTR